MKKYRILYKDNKGRDMCGILAAIGTTDIELAKLQSAKLDHRGPDEQGHQVITSTQVELYFATRDSQLLTSIPENNPSEA